MNVPNLEEWLIKLKHLLLLNQLSAINKVRMGQLNVVDGFQKQ